MSTRANIMVALATIALVGATACGPAARSAANARPIIDAGESSGKEGTTDRIAAGDLGTVQGHTAADAVRQLRPEFLRAGGRPTSPVTASVYVDDRYAGGLEALELIPLRVVTEIRYVGAVAAKSMFGSYCRCNGGIIQVRIRN